ncbi:hypothetical protein [Mycolicibacterium sp. CBMA 361]|uniref:hypothetical protein n=1 Tax=Mycolicibacterium sp. CBMA 361 TaxID=2606610 RepID=UPI0012DD3414|nr:hypothetical protein [Mycolicibacterium sp. CBMA 361]
MFALGGGGGSDDELCGGAGASALEGELGGQRECFEALRAAEVVGDANPQQRRCLGPVLGDLVQQ